MQKLFERLDEVYEVDLRQDFRHTLLNFFVAQHPFLVFHIPSSPSK